VLFEDAHKGLGLIDANAIFFHRFTDDSVPYPADNSKQQQLFEKSDGHEKDAKMIAGAHIVTLMASATNLVPSAPSPFDARLGAVIAPLSARHWGCSGIGVTSKKVVGRG
jgi:hypothetical protein